MSLLLVVDYAQFIGRFHPLIVHLPIGFLLLAVVLEFWPGESVRRAIMASWALGATAAIAAAIAGWLLASAGGYGGPTLFWHRWAGVAVAVLAVGGCFMHPLGGYRAKAYGLLTVGALTLAGHQGGNLTHGEDYLFQYAPPVVQRITGHVPDTAATQDWEATNMDSIAIYANFLRPVINDKCVRCHNSEKQNGGLRMDSAHYILQGGESGPLLIAGDPIKSRWINRVTLPVSHVKAMPPQGERMTYAETKILEHWIAMGADTASVLDLAEVSDELKALLLRDYGLDLRPRLFAETLRASPITKKTKAGLQSLNWNVIDLVPGGAAIEVKPQPGRDLPSNALPELVAAAAIQVTSIALDNQPLTDADLEVLLKFPNLNRLRLNGTQVTALTIERLAQLPHLESLNLYNTAVGNEVLPLLSTYPALRRLFLWQSAVTPAAAQTFVAAHPLVEVSTGITPVSTTESTKK